MSLSLNVNTIGQVVGVQAWALTLESSSNPHSYFLDLVWTRFPIIFQHLQKSGHQRYHLYFHFLPFYSFKENQCVFSSFIRCLQFNEFFSSFLFLYKECICFFFLCELLCVWVWGSVPTAREELSSRLINSTAFAKLKVSSQAWCRYCLSDSYDTRSSAHNILRACNRIWASLFNECFVAVTHVCPSNRLSSKSAILLI